MNQINEHSEPAKQDPEFEPLGHHWREPRFGCRMGLEGLVFQNGYDILREGGTVVVGMSLRNPYFSSRENIAGLLGFTISHFSEVNIFITSRIAVHTYEGLGYTPQRAATKARLQGNAIRNRVIDQLSSFADGRAEVNLVDWDAGVEGHPAFKREHEYLVRLHDRLGDFRHEVRKTTAQVLAVDVESPQVDIGVPFLLKELAFLLASPEILQVKKVGYIYHRRWPIFENLINGEYDGAARAHIGFLIVADQSADAT